MRPGLRLLILVLLAGVLAPAQIAQTQAYTQTTTTARIEVPPIVATRWSSQTRNNRTAATGRLTWNGQPVRGARIVVGSYVLPEPTDSNGQFSYPADSNDVHRYRVAVSDASQASMNGTALTDIQQQQLEQVSGTIDVYFAIRDVTSEIQNDGSIRVSGRLAFQDGSAPPPVVLYAFRLSGRVVDSAQRPVAGVVVTTRSPDFTWTLSEPTDANGMYSSLFWPSSDGRYRVTLVEGNRADLADNDLGVFFPALSSARMDLTLDRSQATITTSRPQAEDGAYYDALLVGLAQNDQPIKPLHATWPDEQGRFTLVLPADLAGTTLNWWQQRTNYFSSTSAAPGNQVDLAMWPTELGARVPREFATLDVPAAP